jgi:transposase
MYDHYIALDWAQSNMAIGRMTKESSQVKIINVPAKLDEMKLYLSRLKGRKILTFEETTTSQWLYVELRDHVDEIVICDPYRNHLLSEGAKTDELDAAKLVQLLKAGLLKPVFHTADQLIALRKLESGYEDTVKAGVRLQNQRAALLRAQGKTKRKKETLEDPASVFVLRGLERQIESYKAEKKRYELEMEACQRKHLMIRYLNQIPGIGVIGALKIAARVVDPKRFPDKAHWLSYCGLARCEKRSGGESYGWRVPRYCRVLKSVFKIAAISVLTSGGKNPFKDYHDHLWEEKHYAEHNARHALARRIAVVAWGVMKSGKAFDAQRISKKKLIAA